MDRSSSRGALVDRGSSSSGAMVDHTSSSDGAMVNRTSSSSGVVVDPHSSSGRGAMEDGLHRGSTSNLEVVVAGRRLPGATVVRRGRRRGFVTGRKRSRGTTLVSAITTCGSSDPGPEVRSSSSSNHRVELPLRLPLFRTLTCNPRGMLLVSSLVVLVAYTIAGGMQSTFRPSLFRLRGCRKAGCTNASGVVNSGTTLMTVMRRGDSRDTAPCAKSTVTRVVVADSVTSAVIVVVI